MPSLTRDRNDPSETLDLLVRYRGPGYTGIGEPYRRAVIVSPGPVLEFLSAIEAPLRTGFREILTLDAAEREHILKPWKRQLGLSRT